MSYNNEDRLRTSCASAEEGREEKLMKEEVSNNQFKLTIPVVMVCACRAPAMLGNARHKPRQALRAGIAA
jgi:hypothetical protein